MRKLVTLRKVSDVQPIPKADAIEVATVDGWQCVVKKGEFKVGQIAVYFEIDSILPKGREEFEFLMARGCKMQPAEDGSLLEGHRLRTIKLRGQVSQGLLIPLPPTSVPVSDDGETILAVCFLQNSDADGPDSPFPYFDVRNFDDDLSDIYGVKKWEKPIPAQLAGMCRGNYPSWLPKTDQERIQNVREIPVDVYLAEEKFEGSSMTVYWDGEKAGVTSRNIDLVLDQEGNSFVTMAKESGLLAFLEWFGSQTPDNRFAIRGELIGPGIQDNIYQLPNHVFMLYDIWINGAYLTPEQRLGYFWEEVADRIDARFVLAVTPIGKIEPASMSREEIISMANGQSQLFPTKREGLVFKSAGLHNGQVFSFKAISPEYLLGETE